MNRSGPQPRKAGVLRAIRVFVGWNGTYEFHGRHRSSIHDTTLRQTIPAPVLKESLRRRGLLILSGKSGERASGQNCAFRIQRGRSKAFSVVRVKQTEPARTDDSDAPAYASVRPDDGRPTA